AAIQLARENNPAYRRTENSLRTADAQMRSTYGALLPTVSSSFSGAFQESGTQIVQGNVFKPPSTYQTSYNLGVNYNISAAALFAPTAVKANRDATTATIT